MPIIANKKQKQKRFSTDYLLYNKKWASQVRETGYIISVANLFFADLQTGIREEPFTSLRS